MTESHDRSLDPPGLNGAAPEDAVPGSGAVRAVRVRHRADTIRPSAPEVPRVPRDPGAPVPAEERSTRRAPKREYSAPDILTAPRYLVALWLLQRGRKGGSMPILTREDIISYRAAEKVVSDLYDYGMVEYRVVKNPRNRVAMEKAWRLTPRGVAALKRTRAYYNGACIGVTLGPEDTPDRNGEPT